MAKGRQDGKSEDTRKNPYRDSIPRGRSLSRVPLYAAIVSQLRDMIVDGRLRPGERINEGDLADYLMVSRTPLREALKILQGEGLIVHHPNRGAAVSRITREHTRDLFEAMAGLERICGEITTRQLNAAKRRELRGLHDELFACHAEGDRLGYLEVNDRIHRAFVELSGNSILSDMHSKLLPGAKRIRFATMRHRQHWDEAVAEHRAIFSAMEAGDAERAGILISQHVQGVGAFSSRMLDRRR